MPPARPIADLLESVLNSIPSGLVVFDRRLNVLHRNLAAKALLPGLEQDLSAALAAAALESKYEDWSAELRRVIDGGLSRQLDLTVDAPASEAERFLHVLLQPVSSPGDAAPAAGLLIITDVSSHISMERRLAVSERLAAVGKLAARVAHELNNPLDGILRFTNLAIRVAAAGSSPDQKLTSYLENARSGIQHMGGILATLLDFSRTTPGALEQATINKIVEDALSTMEGRAHAARVAIVCNFHQTDMPVVRGSSLFQIFCNLIKNAIDAMPDGGTLTITTAIEDDDVLIRFDDTGIGLPPDSNRIFEPFFTTKPPGQGTGLGLAVCRELIEKHGGRVTAERLQPRGTRMTVLVPLRNGSDTVTGRHLARQAETS